MSKLARSEKIAVRAAIRAAVCFKPHAKTAREEAYYRGIVSGIQLVALSLAPARKTVQMCRRFERMERIIAKA